ncbi:hypothetical protein H9P43_005167 [Blastocladiella emersonii ATCC 22665]|nr:hypothetical protein H9P43_005167 [Blastocladiella emersonii ATCC 22665]
MQTAKPITDYTPRFTALSLARKPSAIRALQPLMAAPGMISLAGGLPNPATFPVANVQLTLKDGAVINLGEDATRAALQYGPTPGHPDLQRFLGELQTAVHGPTPKSHAHPRTLCVANGSQDLMAKAIAALVAPGEAILVESPCYVGTLAILRPLAKANGVKLVEVPTDAHGLVPTELEKILAGWPKDTPLPKALYTVPSGGNPSGSMATLERRKAIYALLQRHDLILLEDDPYYYLQFVKDVHPDAASPTALTAPLTDAAAEADLGDAFRRQLVPSYLSMDTDGRVLRFESFSKVVSAGLRLGLVTGPQPLVDRIALDIQATSLQPTGLSQAVFLALAHHRWNNDPRGFLAHAAKVAAFYHGRRDAMLKAMDDTGLLRDGLVELDVPQAGMFLWMRLPGIRDAGALISKYAMDRKVLLLPGLEFLPNAVPGVTECNLVRATYSTASDEQMREGMKRFRECIELAMADEAKQ